MTQLLKIHKVQFMFCNKDFVDLKGNLGLFCLIFNNNKMDLSKCCSKHKCDTLDICGLDFPVGITVGKIK